MPQFFWHCTLTVATGKCKSPMNIATKPVLHLTMTIPFCSNAIRLKNAHGTFQRAMDIILSSVECQFSLVYLHYIFIFSKSPDKHIDLVQQVLMLLNDAGVTLKQKRGELFTNPIDFLRFVIKPGFLAVSSHTIDPISGLQTPWNVTELRAFPGLCNAFFCFVPNFAQIAAPLNQKLRKYQSWIWVELSYEELKALEPLKEILI